MEKLKKLQHCEKSKSLKSINKTKTATQYELHNKPQFWKKTKNINLLIKPREIFKLGHNLPNDIITAVQYENKSLKFGQI